MKRFVIAAMTLVLSSCGLISLFVYDYGWWKNEIPVYGDRVNSVKTLEPGVNYTVLMSCGASSLEAAENSIVSLNFHVYLNGSLVAP